MLNFAYWGGRVCKYLYIFVNGLEHLVLQKPCLTSLLVLTMERLSMGQTTAEPYTGHGLQSWFTPTVNGVLQINFRIFLLSVMFLFRRKYIAGVTE